MNLRTALAASALAVLLLPPRARAEDRPSEADLFGAPAPAVVETKAAAIAPPTAAPSSSTTRNAIPLAYAIRTPAGRSAPGGDMRVHSATR